MSKKPKKPNPYGDAPQYETDIYTKVALWLCCLGMGIFPAMGVYEVIVRNFFV